MSEHSLPSVPLSEQFIMACLLLQPDRLAWVATALPEATMFADGFYQRLYVAMRDVASRDQVPDLGVMWQLFPQEGGKITEVITTLPDELWLEAKLVQRQLETHAALIKDAFVRREASLALSRGETAGAVLERLNGFTSIGQDRLFDAGEVADLVYAELTNQQSRISFPFRLLNVATSGGLRPGEMAIVAARQGGGKSAFLQNIVLHNARAGKRVLFVSAEMGSADLGGRWVTMLSRQQVLRFEGLEDRQAVMSAIAQLRAWKDRLLVQELVNVAGIEQTLRERRGSIDLVCVDYLQKLSPLNTKARSEYERVSDVSRTLDNLCQRYQVPMVVAAQFNRRAEGQQPSIADLRDSGQIEADADLVVSLWQKPDEQGDPAKSKVYLDILKNRNGFTLHNSPGAEYALLFDKPRFVFHNIDQHREEATPYQEALDVFGKNAA
jgi:replicative DNA helicase